MSDASDGMKLSPNAITAAFKGTPGVYLPEFMKHRALIRDCLEQGHNVRTVHAYLRKAGAISFSYATMLRLVNKHLPELQSRPASPFAHPSRRKPNRHATRNQDSN